MDEHRNKRLIERWYHEMWNTWDKSVIPEFVHEQISFRGSLGQEKYGFAGLHDYIDFIKAAFPDFHNEIELIITEGDQSYAKVKYTETQAGEIFGVAPTNRKIAYYGSAVFSFEADKIVDVWVLGDIHGLLQQLK